MYPARKNTETRSGLKEQKDASVSASLPTEKRLASERIGEVNALHLQRPQTELRKANRIKTYNLHWQ
jgi:hypothetical protein